MSTEQTGPAFPELPLFLRSGVLGVGLAGGGSEHSPCWQGRQDIHHCQD